MEEPLLNSSILDQFINSHEQSYEEFLNTFTYLLKEEERKTIHGSKADSLRKIFCTSELPNRNKQDGSPGRSKKIGVSLPPQLPNENELLGDDVHPFSVDEEFDYDCAALTPKFSEAELKAIIDLSEEKKTGTDVSSA